MEPVYIVGAARTPIGSFNGGLSSLPAAELGAVAIRAALERSGLPGGQVDEVFMGQVLTAGESRDPLRRDSDSLVLLSALSFLVVSCVSIIHNF